MNQSRREELVLKANRFYLRYSQEVENLRKLVEVNLNQLCLAYTLDNRLPREAVEVNTRLKSLTSFINKLDRLGWPDFYYPTEVIKDLIGARIVCWFLDDCYGVKTFLEQAHGFRVDRGATEDYIANPKPSGYRSIHLLADFTYDSVGRTDGHRMLTPRTMVCEIQIRTRLQDAYGQLTHEFPYKFSDPARADHCEDVVAKMARALAEQDRAATEIRELVREAYRHEKRVGFAREVDMPDESGEGPGLSPRVSGESSTILPKL